MHHLAFLRAIVLIGCFNAASTSYGQLTYPLTTTLLHIDEVVDSARVGQPWEILWGPDDRLWMTDGPAITRWDPLTDVIDTVLHRAYGNGLGLALHPDFPATPIVIAVFDTSQYYAGGNRCEVSRFTYDAVNDALTDELVLFTYPHSGEHAGGRLLFDTTGHVLLTTADYWTGVTDSIGDVRGRTLRFATDGSIPPDNPRPDLTWTWGHRNPQGLAMLPNGAVVNSEHGQLLNSNEINLIQRNNDHGWPVFDAMACLNVIPDSCTSPTYQPTFPLAHFQWPPAGTAFYPHALIPEMENKLITGILNTGGLMLHTFNATFDGITAQEHVAGDAFDALGRIRDFAVRSDGTVYLITNDRNHARIRVLHPGIGTGLAAAATHAAAVHAWPNPVDEQLTVVADPASVIRLTDVHGRSLEVAIHRIGDRALLGTAALPTGIYVVHVVHEGRSHAARIVKH